MYLYRVKTLEKNINFMIYIDLFLDAEWLVEYYAKYLSVYLLLK
jgi:hypothetical protein